MCNNNKTKLTWGAIIRPTKKCAKEIGLVSYEDWGISLGLDRKGYLAVIVNKNERGEKTISKWRPEDWEILPD